MRAGGSRREIPPLRRFPLAGPAHGHMGALYRTAPPLSPRREKREPAACAADARRRAAWIWQIGGRRFGLGKGRGAHPPKIAGLYAGAGGLDLGFAAAGFECAFANEMRPDACATYSRAMEMAAARRGAAFAHRVAAGDIADARLPARGGVDVVVGGPPDGLGGCENASGRGARRADKVRIRRGGRALSERGRSTCLHL